MATRQTYSAADKQAIIDKVLAIAPNMSMNKACGKIGIAHSVFNRWIHDESNPTNKERYDRARYDYQESIAADIIAIADEPPAVDNFGKTDAGSVNDKRVRIDARKWLLSKIAHKRYGDRLTLGGDEASPLQVVAVKRTIIDKQIEMDDDEG